MCIAWRVAIKSEKCVECDDNSGTKHTNRVGEGSITGWKYLGIEELEDRSITRAFMQRRAAADETNERV